MRSSASSRRSCMEAGQRALATSGRDRRAGPGAGGPRIQHLRPRRELRHPAQAAASLRRQRDPAGFPGDRARAVERAARQHVLDHRAARFWRRRGSRGSAPNLHMVYITNFKCGPDSLHQAFHARGGRRAAAGAAVRRPRQRCRLHDAVRSLSRQQRNPAMLPVQSTQPAIH